MSLSAGWDVLGSGQTWLRASSSRRGDPHAEGVAAAQTDPLVTQSCQWNVVSASFNSECQASGGPGRATVGLPCGPSGYDDQGARCVVAPKMPQVLEHTLGVRQALGQRSWFDVDGVYRRTGGLPVQGETNMVWNTPSRAVTRGGGFRNGRAEAITDLSSSDDAWREYVGLTLSLGGQLGALNGLLAYTYSQQQMVGLLPTGAVVSHFEYPDADEHRHSWRLLATYNLFDIGSVGVVYAYDSGRPFSRYFRPTAGAGYDDLRARVGTNPGVDINNPADDFALSRLPSTQSLHLQARLRVGRWLPFGLDLFVDHMNALTEDSRYGRAQVDGRWTRLGIEFRY